MCNENPGQAEYDNQEDPNQNDDIDFEYDPMEAL